MARYKIYDNSSDVITPVGEVLTAEQWLDRYPWGRFAKMIVGGGVINGSVALIFDEAVEAFEDAPPADTGVSDQTRIADALEDMVALSLPDAE